MVSQIYVQVKAAVFPLSELPPHWGTAYCVTLLMSDGAERRIALGGAHRPHTPAETAAGRAPFGQHLGGSAKGARA